MEMKSEEGTLVSNPAFREASFKPVVSISAVAPIRCAAAARYRECLRNHAASAGGNILDGCGEFMPGGAEGTCSALQCAACSCHRNFHRKEPVGGGARSSGDLAAPPPLLQLPPPPLRQGGGHWTSFVTPMKVAFGSGGGGGGSESSSEEMNFHVAAGGGVAAPVPPYGLMSKKRHRTKFTQEQKMRMLDYAEKVGWRIPREDDVDVQRFCAEVGVKRQVFKVWMHNNKSNTKKQIQQEEP